ncbi:hypothetical protein BP6252_00225 [Coleophoma cylindrospora]|uniref:chitinase n=1 Tax=Coleophoma cylindrospora TaxID=1849047 RepID=A0A3D8SPD6_9HELO|nr:hypothetical protein BP6252_00225 [Coleophoma cylindrospora]
MKSTLPILGFLAAKASAEFVNAVYYDQWHASNLPGKNVTSAFNQFIIAFTDPSLLMTDPPGNYTPFISVDDIKNQFGNNNTKVTLSIGGWTWTPYFAVFGVWTYTLARYANRQSLLEATANETGRALFAKNIASLVADTGADGVDIDWEYPCGNGIDYKQVPNSEKTGEIETFPLTLEAIRSAIGTDKDLSIAVPGLTRDMICYTNTTVPRLASTVDYFHIMTYDLMNRRDNVTKHHSDVQGSSDAVDAYLAMGLPASKAVLGFAFYAKWFTTDPNSDCSTNPIGCATVAMEDANGNDLGTSGALTFEPANMDPQPIPTNASTSTDGTCGAAVTLMCPETYCCSSGGYCGSTNDYCGTGCQFGWGNCTGIDITSSWQRAQAGSVSDTVRGGEYFWDSTVNIFWTWDTPTFITEKFSKIVADKSLGGVMSWSLGEDTYDNSHILAIRDGVTTLGTTADYNATQLITSRNLRKYRG